MKKMWKVKLCFADVVEKELAILQFQSTGIFLCFMEEVRRVLKESKVMNVPLHSTILSNEDLTHAFGTGSISNILVY